MAEHLLNKYKNQFDVMELIPSSGGVFEVTLNDNLIFSKKEKNRFPEYDEIENFL